MNRNFKWGIICFKYLTLVMFSVLNKQVMN